MDKQRLDAIRARLDEVDKHSKAYMNERDPETLAYCNAIITVQDNAYMDERDMLAEIERLTAELSGAREALKGAKAICDVATSEKRKAEAYRDTWRRRAETEYTKGE